jgi:hypothetical protein
MQDGELPMKAAHGAHDRVRDGMIAAEADEGMAESQGPADILLDEIPRVMGAFEGDVAVIDDHARLTQVDAGLGPLAIGVGMEFPADERRRLGRPLHQGGIVVIGDSEQGNAGHLHLPV